MIYIIKDANTHDGEVFTVIETDIAIKKEYKKFMIGQAEKRGIVINPNWLCIMNYEDHHPHLTIDEYIEKKKEWYKIQRDNSLLSFILEILKIEPLEFKIIDNVY